MKNTILSNLYRSKELQALLTKMHPEHLRDDLRQELFLVLASMSEEKLLHLHNTGGLRFYATRIVLNMTCSSSSPFFKMYRRTSVEFGETPAFKLPEYATSFSEEEPFEHRHNALLESVEKSLEGLHWYDRELFTRYVEAGSAEKLRKRMKETSGHPIPKQSILDTVRKVRYAIQEKTPAKLYREAVLC